LLKDLLNKDKTLDLASEVSSAVTTSPKSPTSMDPRVWLGMWALRRSIATERKTIQRTGTSTPKDRKSYLPRDMVLSFLQAHQEERTATGVKDERTVTGVKFAEGASATHGFDYHWVTGFLKELTTHLVRRVLFTLPRDAPKTVAVAPDARIILVGDWGTGEGVALAVAAQMRNQIDAADEREVHVVHLGDVYYAGTRWEAHHRFLEHWPVRPDEAAPVRSWCLNGNHDMYSAGEGLFDVILADDRFSHQRTERDRTTSEFHMRNDHWDIVGLDTSWKFQLTDVRGAAGHLQPRQCRWLVARLTGAGRRRMLLSHHQPFTDRDDGAGVIAVGNLLEATSPLRKERDIDAWFWGHEHRLITYRTRDGIDYAACMGHGAVLEEPAKAAATGAGEAEFSATFIDSDGDEWRMPGFAVVDLAGPTATVRYIDMNGDPWRAPDVL
jgi:hypothetical protein